MPANYFEEVIMFLISGPVEQAIVFLKSKGLLKRSMVCLHCASPMKWSPRNTVDGFVWRCHNSQCAKSKTTRGIRDESIFEGSRTNLRRMIHIYYLWATGVSALDCVKLCGVSRCCVLTYYKSLRQACGSYFERNAVQLGGEGVVCEIDESCFSGRQKYHVGRVRPQIWVFGIVDRSFVPARSYMIRVEKRNAKTLIPIIRRVCIEGTTIHSDEWPAYRSLSLFGFEHNTVCHKHNFVNSADGTHTQAIESLWNKCKCKIKAMRGVLRANLQEYLYEFMWRDIFRGTEFAQILIDVQEHGNVDN